MTVKGTVSGPSCIFKMTVLLCVNRCAIRKKKRKETGFFFADVRGVMSQGCTGVR